MKGWRDQVPRGFAVLLSVLAIVCALLALSLPFRRATSSIVRMADSLVIPVSGNLGYALFVALLAAAVARRKRIGWWILVVYFCLSVLLWGITVGFLIGDWSGMMQGSDWSDIVELGIGILVSVGLLVVLLLARRAFYAKVERVSVLRAFGVLIGLLALFVVAGYGLVRLFPGGIRPDEELLYTVEKVLGGAIRFDLDRTSHAPGWVTFLLGLAGAVALVAAMLTLFRSQRRTAALNVDDERRIRSLLHEYGSHDSLGYFATRRDKAAVFAPSGKAAVTYRVVFGVSLASGDPVGDPEAWPAAIDSWTRMAREYAWTTAVMGASEPGARAYATAGLTALELGDEAIVYTRRFGLEGRDMRPVRQAVARIERAGYRTRIRRHADVPEAEMAEAVGVSEAWRDTEAERGFSMALSRLGDPSDAECVLVEAVDGDGKLAAVLSFVPWGADGLSLDLMRRRPGSENGLMEFMVAQVVEAAPRLGVERISLNFAVFRSTFEEGARIGAGPVVRLWRRILLFFSRFWQLESLYRSNVKYRPVWNPRFLCFGEHRALGRVGLASAAAEGFLASPWGAGGVQPRVPELEGEAQAYVRERESARAGLGAGDAAGALALAGPRRPEQEQVRFDRLQRIRESGVEPYPVGFERTAGCAEVRAAHPALAPDTRTGARVAIAGRVVLVRDHGGVCFATLRDWSGDLQILLTPGEPLRRWRNEVDLGDHVGVRGEVVTSRRGELSVEVADWTLTSKCLRPLPDKHRGLTDPEARVRQRYVDLIVGQDSRRVIRARGAVLASVRKSLQDRGFLEVETPILQSVHGGANARPFLTHINAYDTDLYLRIAPELFLKRLCVGGVERVFELGRNFRNEGVSFKHNPEFTMLEAYQAYADYRVMLDLTRELIQEAARAALGSTVIRHGGHEYDLAGEWPVVRLHDAVADALGEPVSADTPLETLQGLADRARVPYDPAWSKGHLAEELYSELVEAKTLAPTFYIDFPTETAPLTRKHRSVPGLAEKWDLVAFGVEMGTAYSELIDPTDQRRRLTEQSLAAAGGDPEAMEVDEDFLAALEYGMPPTGGLGLGIDRLVMMVTDRPIRQTLTFPLVRPDTGAGSPGIPGSSGGAGGAGGAGFGGSGSGFRERAGESADGGSLRVPQPRSGSGSGSPDAEPSRADVEH